MIYTKHEKLLRLFSLETDVQIWSKSLGFLKHFETKPRLECSTIIRSSLHFRDTIEQKILACFIVAFFLWIVICLVMRYTLKYLLMYKGFMFETRGKGVSLPTKLWAVLVKCE